MFDIYLKQAFIMVAVLSGIPLIVSSLSGLLVAFLQTVTQIQEQSISYLARFVSVSVVVALLFTRFSSEMISFSQQLIASIEFLGRMP